MIPYSGKVWLVESLANLANRLQFAKLKPSKLVVTIDNPLADLLIRQTFLNQARAAAAPRTPGFLKLLWLARRYVCVCVCLSVCLCIGPQEH